MTMLASFVLLLPLVVIAALRELLALGRISRLRAVAVMEQNRDRFGKLRTQMVAMAVEGRIDLRQEPMLSVYRSLTVLMRSPAEHQAAAQQIFASSAALATGQSPSREINADEVVILQQFCEDVNLFCSDYLSIYRMLAWVYDKGRPAHGLPLVLAMAMRPAKPQELSQRSDSLRRTYRVDELCHA